MKFLSSPIATLVRAEFIAMQFRCGMLQYESDESEYDQIEFYGNEDWEIKPSTSPAKD